MNEICSNYVYDSLYSLKGSYDLNAFIGTSFILIIDANNKY